MSTKLPEAIYFRAQTQTLNSNYYAALIARKGRVPRTLVRG